MPRLERAVPAYEQIHDHYAREISEGRLTSEMLLPSARDIAVAWGTSIMTADRALAWLATDGLVTRSRKGTIVKAGRLRPGPQARFYFTEPEGGQVVVRDAGLEYAPRYIHPLLGLEPDPIRGTCFVARREEVRYGPDGAPYSLMVDWINPRLLVPGDNDDRDPLLTAEPLPDPGGPVRLIEARTGIHPVRLRIGWETRKPRKDGREVPLLELKRGARVQAVVWTWYSAAEAMVYTESVYPENTVLEASWDVPGLPAAGVAPAAAESAVIDQDQDHDYHQ